MNGYNKFANVYDRLTYNVEYQKRAKYIHTLLSRYGVSNSACVLDLACGTGEMTAELAKLGYDMIGVDASPAMLSQAQNRMYDENLHFLLLCQDMTELDLYGTVDAAVCTLDSLNHLDSAASVKKAIANVGLFMNPGGIFIFDVNTVYKHRCVLGNNTFVYDCNDVYCVWQNSLNPDDSVDISLDIFESDDDGAYIRTEESFKERAYPLSDISEWLLQAEFEVLNIYDEMTDKPINDKTQRAVFTARYCGKSEAK